MGCLGRQINMCNALDFCSRPVRKETNVPLHIDSSTKLRAELHRTTPFIGVVWYNSPLCSFLHHKYTTRKNFDINIKIPTSLSNSLKLPLKSISKFAFKKAYSCSQKIQSLCGETQIFDYFVVVCIC
jgi:hypothetical protein